MIFDAFELAKENKKPVGSFPPEISKKILGRIADKFIHSQLLSQNISWEIAYLTA